MKDSTKDKTEGMGHEMKGSMKKAVGSGSHDRRLESEGHAEKQAGQMQKKAGDFEKAAGH